MNANGTRVVKENGIGRWGAYELRLICKQEVTAATITIDGKDVGEVTVKFRDPRIDGDPPKAEREFELDPPKISTRQRITGAAKLVKAELTRKNTIAIEVVQARQAQCESCTEHYDFGRCLHAECGCYLWAKTRQKQSRCPIGRWEQ